MGRGEVWPARDRRKRRREGGEEREREREKKSAWTQEVWRSPFTCQVIRWCVHTPEMSQPNTPRSLQITATDNKQLFTCWMRVGVETKVFCRRSKCASEHMHTSLKASKRASVNTCILKKKMNLSIWCDLSEQHKPRPQILSGQLD